MNATAKSRSRRYATLLWIALPGCAVDLEVTPRNHGLTLPERWLATDDAAQTVEVRLDWWREFGDPTLDQLVARSFAHNRDLAAAAARLTTAIARAKLAGAQLGPSIDARFDATRLRQNFIGLPIGGTNGIFSNTNNNFGLGLDLSWEIDLWGRLRAGQKRAQEVLDAAGADYHGARLSLAGQTAQSWFAVIEARAQLALAERTAQLFEQSAGRIRTRFERGTLQGLDLRLATNELESARAAIALRKQQLERATRALDVLVGDYPDGDVPAGAVLPAMPGPLPGGLPVEVLARRPDLAAAENRLAAADASVTEARADRWPRLALTASGGTRTDAIEDLVDGDLRVWSLAGNLLAPLFDNGRRRAQVEIRDAERHEAWANWAGAVLRAAAEVEGALAAEEHLDAQLRHVTLALEEARAAREISDDRYGRGLLDIVTLLSAQRREVDAESRMIGLLRQRLDLRVDLLLALGGGFATPPRNDATSDEAEPREEQQP